MVVNKRIVRTNFPDPNCQWCEGKGVGGGCPGGCDHVHHTYYFCECVHARYAQCEIVDLD